MTFSIKALLQRHKQHLRVPLTARRMPGLARGEKRNRRLRAAAKTKTTGRTPREKTMSEEHLRLSYSSRNSVLSGVTRNLCSSAPGPDVSVSMRLALHQNEWLSAQTRPVRIYPAKWQRPVPRSTYRSRSEGTLFARARQGNKHTSDRSRST